LERLAAEPPATGVAKYFVKLERDDFNSRNQLTPPTGVERYLAAGLEVTRPPFSKGPSGVERYLAAEREVSRPVPRKVPTGVQQYLATLDAGAAAER
jgi:hypothetical protein